MERQPKHPLTPRYLESYIYLIYASNNPEMARTEGVEMLNADTGPLESILLLVEDTKQLQVVLTEVLGSSLRASASDLSIERREDISEEDLALLRAYSLGAWPKAVSEASDLLSPGESIANPLANVETVRDIWHYVHDRRHALPDIERLIPGYDDVE